MAAGVDLASFSPPQLGLYHLPLMLPTVGPSVLTTATAQPLIPGLSANQVQRLLALLDTPTPSTEPLTGQQPAQFPPWLIDSGASHPMTGNLSFFAQIYDLSLPG